MLWSTVNLVLPINSIKLVISDFLNIYRVLEFKILFCI